MAQALYIVATPIGNLADITYRAVEVLKQVDCIAAEDTRHSKRLLEHYEINTPLLSYHEFGGDKQLNQVLERLKNDESVALISDAGTPLISDPGYRLVVEAKQMGCSVVPVPGVSAVTTALSVAGLPTDQFSFRGFLPAKQKARCDVLEAIKDLKSTTVFYEAPHRILVTLKDCVDVLGAERLICLQRELTKTFETIELKPAGQLLEWVEADSNQQRGEMVLVIGGSESSSVCELDAQLLGLAQSMLEHMPPKTVSKILADFSGIAKKSIYQALLDLKKG